MLRGHVPILEKHANTVIKKKIYDKIGMYYPNFKISSDYEFMLRAFKIHKYNPYFLNQILVKMRIGGASTKNIKNILIGNKEIYQAWKMNNLRVPRQLYIMRFMKKIRQMKIK